MRHTRDQPKCHTRDPTSSSKIIDYKRNSTDHPNLFVFPYCQIYNEYLITIWTFCLSKIHRNLKLKLNFRNHASV